MGKVRGITRSVRGNFDCNTVNFKKTQVELRQWTTTTTTITTK